MDQKKVIRIFSILLLLTLVGLAPFLWVKWSNSRQLDPLFSEYFVPYPMESDKIIGEYWQKALDKIATAYRQEDYETASRLLGDLVSEHPENSYVLFFFGNSLLAKKPPKAHQAVEVFSKVFTVNNGWVEAARWYLALAYLKAGKREQAQTLLWEIARQTEGYQRKQAREIIDELMVQ